MTFTVSTFKEIPKTFHQWDRFFRNLALSIRGVNAEAFISNYVAKTADYTATADDLVIDCTSGTFTVTLPSTIAAGKPYIIKNSGGGTITVSGSIDGGSSESVTTGNVLRLRSTGSGYIKC